MGAYSGSLGVVGQEVLHPQMDRLLKSQFSEFRDQLTWHDCVKGRAEVYIKHSHIALLVLSKTGTGQDQPLNAPYNGLSAGS